MRALRCRVRCVQRGDIHRAVRAQVGAGVRQDPRADADRRDVGGGPEGSRRQSAGRQRHQLVHGRARRMHIVAGVSGRERGRRRDHAGLRVGAGARRRCLHPAHRHRAEHLGRPGCRSALRHQLPRRREPAERSHALRQGRDARRRTLPLYGQRAVHRRALAGDAHLSRAEPDGRYRGAILRVDDGGRRRRLHPACRHRAQHVGRGRRRTDHRDVVPAVPVAAHGSDALRPRRRPDRRHLALRPEHSVHRRGVGRDDGVPDGQPAGRHGIA